MPAEWRFLVTLNGRLRPLKQPAEIQELAVRLLGEHLHANRVNYSHLDGDEFVISRSYADGTAPFSGRGPVVRLGTAVVEACRRGETVVVNDVHREPRLTDAEREDLLAQDVAALVEAPLMKDGEWVGTFSVHSARPRRWTADQITLIEITAEHSWAVEERSRAEEALGRTESRQAFLRRLNDTVRPLAAPARILEETCRLLGEYLRVNRVVYGEVDGDDLIIAGGYVNDVPSIAGRVSWPSLGGSRLDDILKGATLSVADTSTGPHTPGERAALQAAAIGAYICPLLIKGGRFIAVFGIHSRSPRAWTHDEIRLAQEVADRTWATLEHRKAEADLRANEARLAFLLRLNDVLRPLSQTGDVLHTAARLLGEHLGASGASYADLDGREYIVRPEHSRVGAGPLVGPLVRTTQVPQLREALRRGQTVAIADVETDPRLGADDRVPLLSRQIHAYIGAALFRDGRMAAAFGASSATPRAWTTDEIDLVRDAAVRTWAAVERSRAEAALLQQEQRLRLALEASEGGSWTWIAATNETDWDERFRALYGFTPDEPAIADGWLPRIHEEDRHAVLALLDEIVTSNKKDSWQHTFRIVRPDGAVAWIQSRGRAERDSEGGVTRLTGLDLDFSQHHFVEEASRVRRDEQHDRTLRTLLETATQGFVSVDADGVIVSANRALHDLFGWPPGELIGQEIERLMPSAFRTAHPSDRAAPRPRRMGGDMHLVGERKDGSTFPIEVSLNHVVTPEGGHGFAFVTDITERQRAASALQAHADELQYRTTQLSRMASDLTLAEQRARQQIASTLHDGLQQFLAIAAINLDQQLKHEDDVGAPSNELIREARQQLEEAIAAARDLTLELSPPVLQHSGFPAALVWLANWMREKYKMDVQVVADPHADTPRTDVRTLLFESVRELLFNAVKHAQANRVTVGLTLTADDQLCITVTDQGRGFNPTLLDHRSKAETVGWGLFSIRERLSLLGGRFEIDSAAGRGTQARLIAPRGGAPQATADQQTLRLPPAGPVSAAGDGRASRDVLRILIVDDHAAMRNALRAILQTRPQFSVVGDASNGFEAVAHAHTLRPDVILMDVAMPHMDGVEATTRIRAELPQVRVLGVSMLTRSEIAHALENAGAEAFFAKGSDTQRLINYLLALHAARGVANRVSR